MQKILYSPTSYLPMVNISLSKFNFKLFCIDKSYDKPPAQISFFFLQLVGRFLFIQENGSPLRSWIKVQDNFFERDVFIGSIMNFYERVRGKPIEKLRFPTKI